MRIEAADVQDQHVLRRRGRRASQVFHFAAQVAVTTSLVNAVHDFEVNARGTLNLLEAIRARTTRRRSCSRAPTRSTAAAGRADARRRGGQAVRAGRRAPAHPRHRRARPLDFHSPYGCSKGAADQYVVDYARTFGLPAACSA
jgi:CDP-paratose 2-epimerase